MDYPVLSTVIFLPILGALLIFLIKRSNETFIRWMALAVSLINFVLSIPLFTRFDKTTAAMQFMEKRAWIPAWGINYSLGVDGISVLFVLLSTLLTILCVTVSWNSIKHKTKVDLKNIMPKFV